MYSIIYMSSSSIDSAVSDGLEAYGKVKATISVIISIVFAVILMCIGWSAYNSKKQNVNNKKNTGNPILLCGIGIAILVGGILYYRYIMSNKYAAIENAVGYNRFGYNPFGYMPYGVNRGLLNIRF
jgi:hypothetical protein